MVKKHFNRLLVFVKPIYLVIIMLSILAKLSQWCSKNVLTEQPISKLYATAAEVMA